MSHIERIDVTYHRLPLEPPFPAAWDRRPRHGFPVTVVRVRDTDGRVGVGAGDAVRGLVDYLELFIGHEAGDLARHGAVLDNIAFHDGRPWPLDTALWDLAAKTAGLPLWRLLGGESGRVRLYASWGTIRPPRQSAERAAAATKAGFDAVKLRFGAESLAVDLDRLAAVRDAVGPDVAVMVDCNQGWRMPWDTEPPWEVRKAQTVAAALGEFDVYWMEEPLHRGDHAGMAQLRHESPVPLAGGEMTREVHEFDLMLARGCLDVYQPDVVVTGGFGALAELAARVVAAGHVFSPHTWGSGIGLVANAQLVAGTVGTPFLEFPLDPPEWTVARRDFLLGQPVEAAAGWIDLGDGPGLGVRLDEDALAATETDRMTW